MARHTHRGIYPVVFTFFDASGDVDEALMREQIDVCIAHGVHGLVLLGFVSQFYKFDVEEKIDLLHLCAEAVGGRVPFALTLTETSIRGQKKLIRAGAAAGAAWFIAQPAVKFPVPSETFLPYFLELAAETDKPFAIQNAPDTGVYFSAAFLGRLREAAPNISMLKGEGTTAQSLAAMKGLTDRFTVFSGQHGMDLVTQLMAGAQGSVPAPLLFDVQVRVFELFDAGGADNLAEAEALQARAVMPLQFLTSGPNLEHVLPHQKLFFLKRLGRWTESLHERHPAPAPTEDGMRMVEHFAGQWPVLT